MKRRKFLAFAGISIAIAGVSYYLVSDKSNFLRADSKTTETSKISPQLDEKEILF